MPLTPLKPLRQPHKVVNGKLFLFLELFQRPAELVGARSDFVAAADSVEFAYDVVDFLSCDEVAYALGVAVAASEEEHLLDDVVVVGGDVDEYRAGALGGILDVFHFYMLIFSSACSFLGIFHSSGGLIIM